MSLGPITLHQSLSNKPCNGDTPVPLPPRKPRQFHQHERLWCLSFRIPRVNYDKLLKKREKLSRKIVYHQDNSLSYRSQQAMAAIYDSGFELIPHSPYSSDLAPSEFHLFPHLKKITFWHSFYRYWQSLIARTSYHSDVTIRILSWLDLSPDRHLH
ncbi:hypothetical protein LAZ67_12000739, partial [Cordylochernes scorpioides]